MMSLGPNKRHIQWRVKREDQRPHPWSGGNPPHPQKHKTKQQGYKVWACHHHSNNYQKWNITQVGVSRKDRFRSELIRGSSRVAYIKGKMREHWLSIWRSRGKKTWSGLFWDWEYGTGKGPIWPMSNVDGYGCGWTQQDKGLSVILALIAQTLPHSLNILVSQWRIFEFT